MSSSTVDVPSDPYTYKELGFIGFISVMSILSFAGLVSMTVYLLRHKCRGRWCCLCCHRSFTCCGSRSMDGSLLSFFVLFAVTGVLLSWVVMAPSMFDRMPPIAACFICLVPTLVPFLLIALCPHSLWGYTPEEDFSPSAADKKPLRQRVRQIWPVLLIGCALVITYCFLIPFVTEDICFSSEPFHLTTKFTRKHYISPVCPAKGVCHVYVTLPEDCARDMVATFHTARACTAAVAYAEGDQENVTALTRTAQGGSLKMELEIDRFVHFVPLRGLLPDTLYSFAIDVSCDQSDQIYQFRTCPASTEVLPIIFGGDCGTYSAFPQFRPQVQAIHPALTVIGGDLAYANAMPQCMFIISFYIVFLFY